VQEGRRALFITHDENGGFVLQARFGADVPNLGAWRRSVTGDLTAARWRASTS